MMQHPKKPVVWLIWDGAAGWATRRMLEEGALPALGSLAATGVSADALVPSPNCQTPPSLATLFTGTWPRQHGIHGFSVPKVGTESNPLAYRSGFDPDLLGVDPIWSYLGHKKCSSVLVNIPWVMSPSNGEVPEGVVFATEGYSHRVTRGGVFEIHPKQIGQNLSYQVGSHLLEISTERNAKVTIKDIITDQQIVLRLNENLSSEEKYLMFENGERLLFKTHFRSHDGALLLLHTGIWRTRTFPSNEQSTFENESGPFIGEGLGNAYRRGVFGPRLAEGGNGEAERVLLRTISWSADYFRRCSMTAVERHPGADLYMFYQPCIDDIEHELIGWCDPCSKAYRPDIEEQTWAILREVYQMADRHLATLLKHFGNECTVIVSSDHGMAGMTHTIHVNESLAQAELLTFNMDHKVDLERTVLFYHPANNGSLWINPSITDFKTRQDILSKGIAALRCITHPEDGTPAFHAIYPIDDEFEETGYVPTMGDLFVAANDGFELSAEQSPDGQVIVPTLKSASHATNPNRPSLRGIFYARGEHIAYGRDLKVVDNRSVFPLICHQLGVSSPKNIEGVIHPEISNSYVGSKT